MERRIRRRKNMAVRVRDFSRANPSTDPAFVAALGRLDQGILKLTELENAQTGGFTSKHSATTRRRELRRRLREGLLRHLVTVGQDIALGHPEIRDVFRLPEHNITTGAFQSQARKLLEEGVARKDLLLEHGLSPQLLDDLKVAVDEFDASVAASNDGLLGHVMARAALKRVSDEIMQLVEIMDGINRYRFVGQPELMAAWESAKHVVTGPQTAEEKAEDGPAESGPGEVKPAA
jgi:hypothetical protein